MQYIRMYVVKRLTDPKRENLSAKHSPLHVGHTFQDGSNKSILLLSSKIPVKTYFTLS